MKKEGIQTRKRRPKNSGSNSPHTAVSTSGLHQQRLSKSQNIYFYEIFLYYLFIW